MTHYADQKFLRAVARYYIESGADLSRLTLVFPNKRSAMFMRRYLKEFLRTRVRMMPTLRTLPAFVNKVVSNVAEPERVELLFLLYDSYTRIITETAGAGAVRPFDEFIFWGDMMLADFDDADANDVDCSMLFKNLNDLREIESFYLTPEQCDVIEQQWGFRPPSALDVDRFWKHVNHTHGGTDGNCNCDGNDGVNAEDDSTAVKSFVNLWSVMGRIYQDFRHNLLSKGMAYRGMMLRMCADRIDLSGLSNLPFERVAFVGLNVAPNALCRVFRRLSNLDKADFFWDIPSIYTRYGLDETINDATALRRVLPLSRQFKMPQDFKQCDTGYVPDIKSFTIGSGSMQTRIASQVLKHWVGNNIVCQSAPDSTAIVLPDPALLTPMLYALPQEISTVNITMGLPYRDTPMATLMHDITSMHLRARMVLGGMSLFYDDVVSVASNPNLRIINRDACDKVLTFLEKRHQFYVPVDELLTLVPELDFVFDTADDIDNPQSVRRYIDKLLYGLAAGLGIDLAADPDEVYRRQRLMAQIHNENGRDGRHVDVEKKVLPHEERVIRAYARAVDAIDTLSLKYHLMMNRGTLLTLVERMLYSQTITITGTPLRGVQVMGMLETRALDFDNVIVLSLNERIYPRRHPLRTLIPNVLRRAYLMTTIDDVEAEQAYMLMRLISRAHNVALVSDSRPSGISGAGEISRFVTQLRLMLPPDAIVETDINLTACQSDNREVSIPKSPMVMARLNRFRADKDNGQATPLFLSASALKTYLCCPLRFYLKNVCKLAAEDDEKSRFMDSATFGSVFHRVFELLYLPYKNRLIENDDIDRMMARNIKELALGAIDEIYFTNKFSGHLSEMPGESQVLADVICDFVRAFLRVEKLSGNTPFTFIGAETGPKGVWEITPGIKVNFVAYIDHIDLVEHTVNGNHVKYYRFIDYKTGSDKNRFACIDDIFGAEQSKRRDAIFQLLLYAHAASEMETDNWHRLTLPIRPEIYRMRKVYVDNDTYIYCGGDSATNVTLIDSHLNGCVDGFREALAQKVAEIFDEDVPFSQCDDKNNCRYCEFLDLCQRTPPQLF